MTEPTGPITSISSNRSDRSDSSDGRSAELSRAAADLARTGRLLIVPGFGLAAARAQAPLLTLDRVLRDRGTDVRYLIHPLAGRLPGQLNTVLADVDRGRLHTPDEVVAGEADLVLTVGANDVINPMPELPGLDLGEVRRLIVLQRSPGPGFAGVDNPLLLGRSTLNPSPPNPSPPDPSAPDPSAPDPSAPDPRISLVFGDLHRTLAGLTAEVVRLNGAQA